MIKKVITLVATVAFVGLFAAPTTASADCTVVVSPGSNSFNVPDNGAFQLVVDTSGCEGAHELEVDFDSDSAFGSGEGGFTAPGGVTGFSLYGGGDIYGGDEALFDAAGVSAELDSGVWTILFGGATLEAMIEHGTYELTIAVRDSEEKGLWGFITIEDKDYNNPTEESTFEYTIVRAEQPSFTLSGFVNQVVYVNRPTKISGTLKVPGLEHGVVDTKLYGLILRGGDDETLSATSEDGQHEFLLEPNPWHVTEFEMAENALKEIPVTILFTGTEIKTHTLTFTIEDDDENRHFNDFEHQFTLDVRNRPSGGGSSRPADRDDDKEEEVEETEDEGDSTLEFEDEEYDLETMTDEEKGELVNTMRTRLLALLLELIARLQAMLGTQ